MKDPLEDAPLKSEPKKTVLLKDVYKEKEAEAVTSKLKKEDPIAYDVPMRIKDRVIWTLHITGNEKGRWYAYYGWGHRVLHANMVSGATIPQLFDRLREFLSKEDLVDKGI